MVGVVNAIKAAIKAVAMDAIFMSTTPVVWW
jgi:hypothetical protein